MTYKLLAADDEYWVREKLRRIIDWAEYDIEFLEPACNGEEVLERIDTDCPDIVITDINMPGISGVELLERAAHNHENIVFLVISGYDTFDYVKRSLRSGAFNYLLKPVTRPDMISVITEALQILRERKAQGEELERQRKQLLLSSSLLRDQELSLLLDKPMSDREQALPGDITPPPSGYGMMLMKIHDMTHAMEEHSYNISSLSYMVKSRLLSVSGMERAIVFNYLSKSNEFILLTDRRIIVLHDAAKKYIALLEEIFRCPVTVVIAGQSYAPWDIRSGYQWAENQLGRRRFASCSEVISADAKDQPDNDRLVWSEEMHKQLAAYLSGGKREMVSHTLIDKSGLSSADQLRVSCGAIRLLMERMNHSLLSGQTQRGAEDASTLSNMAEEVIRAVDSLDMERLLARENELIDAVMAGCPMEESDSMRGIVRRVQEDIDSHYYEELTLTSLAQKYIVERTYLSRCFKQETGENLMMYLAKRRISKAIELMQEDKVSLNEISFLVGYDDYTYFSRVFKKVTGQSPREYKSRNLSGKEGGDQ